MLLRPLGEAVEQIHTLSSIDVAGRAARTVVHTPKGRLAPNVEDWRAGDVLLFSPVSGKRPHPVTALQSWIFRPELARWSHVGMLDGEDLVWDAHPDGHVRRRVLAEALKDDVLIGVRRFRHAMPELDRLADSLLEFSNDTYSAFNIRTAGALAARLRGKAATAGARREDDKLVVCSSFVQKVLQRTLRMGVLTRHLIALPADFADDAAFAWVEARWCAVGAADL